MHVLAFFVFSNIFDFLLLVWIKDVSHVTLGRWDGVISTHLVSWAALRLLRVDALLVSIRLAEAIIVARWLLFLVARYHSLIGGWILRRPLQSFWSISEPCLRRRERLSTLVWVGVRCILLSFRDLSATLGALRRVLTRIWILILSAFVQWTFS